MADEPRQDGQLKVTVITPQGPVFKGAVASLSSFNAVGPFDILHAHASFITLVERQLILRFAEQKPPLVLPVDRGVLRCRKNNLVVYLGLAEKLTLRPAAGTAGGLVIEERH